MAYQLKDKDLQKRLDEISFGAFSEELAARTGDLDWLYNDSHVESVRICFNRKGRLRHSSSGERFSVLLTAEDIEKTVDFKDGTWNNFDVVRPPTGAWLAVEYDELCYDGKKVRRGVRAKYEFNADTGAWGFVRDDGDPLFGLAENVLFRLWPSHLGSSK